MTPQPPAGAILLFETILIVRYGSRHVVLHRDIYWLGKQWAVTGYGVQAVDKKLDMKFDIQAGRIWGEGLPQSKGAETWFDTDDFAEALKIARRRALENPTTFQQVWGD